MTGSGHRNGEANASRDREVDADESADAASDVADGAGAEDVDPDDAFAALSDPIHVAILEELAAHGRDTGEAFVGFADLRRRVGVRDSGRFRYHLRQLQDQFVAKGEGDGEAGYRLTVAGHEVVGAIYAGTYTERRSLGPAPLESTCRSCDAQAIARYEHGRCTVTCENDHFLFQWHLPPNAADAPLPTVVERAELRALQAIERARAGMCPLCYDDIACAVDPEPDAPRGATLQPRFRALCDTCGAVTAGPVTFCLLVEPRVVTFYREHDRQQRDAHLWEPAVVADPDAVTVAETDPVRLAVEITIEGNSLEVTLDDSARVLAVTREG